MRNHHLAPWDGRHKGEGNSMTILSRRQFLTLLVTLPIIGGYLSFSRRSPIVANLDDDLVLVRGWILKRSDLPEGFFE